MATGFRRVFLEQNVHDMACHQGVPSMRSARSLWSRCGGLVGSVAEAGHSSHNLKFRGK